MFPWLLTFPCDAAEPDRVDVVVPKLAPGDEADGAALMRAFGPGTGFLLRGKTPIQVELVATLLVDDQPAQAWHSVPFLLRPGQQVHVSQALPLAELPLEAGWTVARAEPVSSWGTRTPTSQRAWLLITALPVTGQAVEVSTAVVRLEHTPPQSELSAK